MTASRIPDDESNAPGLAVGEPQPRHWFEAVMQEGTEEAKRALIAALGGVAAGVTAGRDTAAFAVGTPDKA
jgi:hypothetical protein